MAGTSHDDRICETITAEHAVLIPMLPSVKSLMPYVEAVAVVIGSCHIQSVFEDRDNVKLYLNDKRFVDILVNNGVSILGRRTNVDYAVPRADKVILSNVDPIIPDAVLMKILSMYGSLVSVVIHEKLASNSEYSHIECGKRKIYMNISPEKKIPSKIKFAYQKTYYEVNVVVEYHERNGACVVEPTPVNEEPENDNVEEMLEVQSNRSMKPNIIDLAIEGADTPAAFRNKKQTTTANSATTAARKIRRRARKGLFTIRKTKRLTTGNPVYTTQSRVKKLAKRTISTAVRRRRSSKRVKLTKDSPGAAVEQDTTTPIDIADSNTESEIVEQTMVSNNSHDPVDPQAIGQYPLSVEDLEKFIFRTRFHRDPLQLAKEFLGEDNPESIGALRNQIRAYQHATKDVTLKVRLRRLTTIIVPPEELENTVE